MQSAEIGKCLEEIGMPKIKVEEFKAYALKGDRAGKLRVLNRFREEKLKTVHGIYKDLECIDYIIAETERGNL